MARVRVSAASLIVLMLLGSAPAVIPEAAAGETSASPPNILILMTDDQPVGTMRVMPNLRSWLGRGGVTYTEGYVTTPLCCPSRASIFTGRYAHNHGVWTNDDEAPHALDHERTFQRYLTDAGYRTGYFGKHLNGWPLDADPPHFEEWALLPRGRPHGYRGATWNLNGTIREVNAYSTRFVGRRAVQFMRKSADDPRPWLAMLSVWAPHRPTVPDRPYREAKVPPWNGNPALLSRDRTGKPPHVLAKPLLSRKKELRRARGIRTGQLRTLMSVDDLAQKLRRELRALGQVRDTLVIFLSDNGFLWREYGVSGKSHPYTRSIKVPLLMRWPGVLPRGTRDERIAANIDLAPTILDAAGIPQDLDHLMDGRSLLRSWERDRLLHEFHQGPHVPSWASIRTPAFQYVEYYEGDDVTFLEYYDLVQDPWQLRNLLGDDDPETGPDDVELALLAQQLDRDRSCRGVQGPTACP